MRTLATRLRWMLISFTENQLRLRRTTDCSDTSITVRKRWLPWVQRLALKTSLMGHLGVWFIIEGSP